MLASLEETVRACETNWIGIGAIDKFVWFQNVSEKKI